MNKDLSFNEKLNILYCCIFHYTNNNKAANTEEFQNLIGENNGWNEVLNLFYTTFAKQERFMKCLYDIKTSEELVVDNNYVIIAKERQNVCAYGIEIETGKLIYVDNTNKVVEPLDMKVDDFILFLIAIQSSEYLLCSGRISNCSDLLKTSFSDYRLTNQSDDGAVYYFDDGVILVVNGKDAFVSATDDLAMESFERNLAFDVDYF